MQAVINQAYTYASRWLGQGQVASYIPQLSKADINDLGICATTMDGHVYCSGTWEKRFTMQSMCKIILLATALQDSGFDKVFSTVGMEPTGDSFDSIVRLETSMHHPANPLINAGAIAVISCIKGECAKEKFGRIISLAGQLLGNDDVWYDNDVFDSESKTGDKNRALAYMMKSLGVFDADVSTLLEVYFKACSISANCKEISHMGMILANNGANPKTNEVTIQPFHSKTIRSLMVTCGMYNSSGEFALRVGAPAKSGVGGGIVAAIPNRMGVAVFSPGLDSKGNSLCGIKALEFLSANLELSIF